MPDIAVTEPGDVLTPFTAVAVAAEQGFSLGTRANALIQISGTQPWAFSSDGTNFCNVAAGKGMLFPILTGQGSTKSWFFKRTGANDSVLSVQVAG